MRQKLHSCLTLITLALMWAWPATGEAQTVAGEASVVRAIVLGATSLLPATTTLADTGPLSAINSALDTSMDTGNVPSLVTAEVLSAGTISWPDEVDSVASLGNVNLNVAGSGIHADSVLARASQVLGGAGYGTSIINNFSINGIPIAITGAANQMVGIPGGQVIVNEQTISQSGAAVVNAIHVIVTGVADVVLASATAGIS